jgi:cell division protein ZapA (FtsZ GTPase activity inhibitor)
MKNEMTISLAIADRTYKLVILSEHEELFRKAVRLIEKRMKDYSSSYAYKDRQDLLAMVAIEYVSSHLENEEGIKNKESEVFPKLMAIDAMLNQHVEEKAPRVL